MVCNHKDSSTKEFILPFEECFKNSNCLHLKYSVVHLHSCEVFRHEACRSACLPGFPLAIYCTYARHRCITDNPNWITGIWIDQFQNGQFTSNRLNIIETHLMEQFPIERLAIPADCREWTSIGYDIWHEMGQILYKTQESLDIFEIPRCVPLTDTCHFVHGCV